MWTACVKRIKLCSRQPPRGTGTWLPQSGTHDCSLAVCDSSRPCRFNKQTFASAATRTSNETCIDNMVTFLHGNKLAWSDVDSEVAERAMPELQASGRKCEALA